jgi:hypothetical protein
VKWEYLIVDEGHRLKNAESKLFGILTTFYFKRRLLLTGKGWVVVPWTGAQQHSTRCWLPAAAAGMTQ